MIVKFEWSEKCFHKLKKLLTTASVLTLPDGNGTFVVYNNASLQVLECALMQHVKFIAYASRQLKDYEKRYPAHDL